MNLAVVAVLVKPLRDPHLGLDPVDGFLEHGALYGSDVAMKAK